MKILFIAVFYFAVVHAEYSITVTRVNNLAPALTSQKRLGQFGSSVFTYNYNSAYVPVYNQGPGVTGALFVRCQNDTSSTDPYAVGPSVISVASRITSDDDLDSILFETLESSSVAIEPNGPDSSFGTEDPRAVYRHKDGTYYILYSAVANTTGGIPVSRLSLATTTNIFDKSTYTLHGPVFPQIKWSKSGSLLIRDNYTGPSYLFWGDSSIVPGLQVATTNDLLNYQNNDSIWLPVRPNMFDSLLVEAGPMPLQLSDGNYLFLYNSARHGYPSKKPNWDIQYNVGYCILDENDPSIILERSENPIFSPKLDWEIGRLRQDVTLDLITTLGTTPYLGLTPNVVFVEGWYPLPNKKDEFVIFYGAADSVVGVALLKVEIN